MGNYRSGRWRNHQKKILVEYCLQIDIRDTSDEFQQLCVGQGKVPMRTYAGRAFSEPKGRLWPLDDGGRLLTFLMEFANGSVEQRIPLLTPNETSERGETVFQCPANHCEKSARKLYLPPGRTRFLCRTCHKLAYRSQQNHDPRVTNLKKDPDRLIELMAEIDPTDFDFSKVLLLRRAGVELLYEIDEQLPDYTMSELLAAGLLDEENLSRLADHPVAPNAESLHRQQPEVSFPLGETPETLVAVRRQSSSEPPSSSPENSDSITMDIALKHPDNPPQ